MTTTLLSCPPSCPPLRPPMSGTVRRMPPRSGPWAACPVDGFPVRHATVVGVDICLADHRLGDRAGVAV